MIKCSDVEILLIVGILMFSLINSSVSCVLAWILAGLIIIHIIFSRETWNKLFDKLMN